MAAPSVASRSNRPAPRVDNDDVVLARALEFSQWARRHARIIIIVAVLAAVALGGLIYYRSYQANRAERAAAEFMQLERSIVASGDPGVAATDLQRFIERFDGTTYANEARVLLGRLRLQAGQAQEAIPVLQQAADRIGRSPVAAQAGLLLGAAYEQTDNPQAAIDTYLRVGRDARFDFERRQALAAAATLRQQANDYAGAADLYRQLVDMTEEGSFDRTVYEMRLAEAEALAQRQE